MLFHSLPHHNVPCSHSCLPSLPGTHGDHISYRAFALAVPSARNSLSTDFDTDGSFSSLSVGQMLPPVRGLLISLLYDSLFYNRHCYFILSYFFYTHLLLSFQLWNLKALSPKPPTIHSRHLIKLLNEWISLFHFVYCKSTNFDKAPGPKYILHVLKDKSLKHSLFFLI